MKDMTDNLLGAYPLTWKACYPRNIVVPPSFCDPKYYAATMVGSLMAVQDSRMRELSHMNEYLMTLSLMANKVPTYFVASEFAYSVANTDLPGDFKFVELQWPLPAMLFVLPDDFVSEYYGHYAPFLAVSKTASGEYPLTMGKLPRIEFSHVGFIVSKERVNVDHPYYRLNEVPCDYNGSYNSQEGVEVFREMKLTDTTRMEELIRPGTAINRDGDLSGEKENEFIQKAHQLAVKMLLSVAALPSMVEHGRVTRHARTNQQGKTVLPELVSANVIGRAYRIPRKYSERAVAAGERAKPRFVYRRGHWTWQAKRYKDREFVSVSQMPRKLDNMIDFDAAGPAMEAKFRACHERILIEGFLFGDQDDSDKTPVNQSVGKSP